MDNITNESQLHDALQTYAREKSRRHDVREGAHHHDAHHHHRQGLGPMGTAWGANGNHIKLNGGGPGGQ